MNTPSFATRFARRSEKFLILRDFIANFLIEYENINLMDHHNKDFLGLQTAILDMLYELLDYGFYSSVASLKKILRPLLSILDSRKVRCEMSTSSTDTFVRTEPF